jgi:putative ABC transport system permease protein
MPDWKQEIARRLSGLRLPPVREAEIIDELNSHLQDRYAELERSGMTPDEAHRTILEDLQDNELLARELHSIVSSEPAPPEPIVLGSGRAAAALSGLLQDFRYSLRALRRHRGFTAVAVLTLALGIGANTAIFSVINALLVRPLPYPDPNRLVMVWESRPREHVLDSTVSPADFTDWRARQRVFQDMAAEIALGATLTEAGEPVRLFAAGVASSYFKVWGLTPILGRDFRPEEDRTLNRVVIISRGLWERQFGGDPAVIGRPVTLNGAPYEVIGVVSDPNTQFHVWYPLDFSNKDLLTRVNHFLRVYARMKPGITIQQAQKDMDRISAEIQQEVEQQNQGHASYVIALREQLVGNLRPSLAVLVAAVGFVLLIACANVGNLILARGASLQRELSIRQAIGASRFQILRQYWMECLWLGLLGTAAAVPLAVFGTEFLKIIAPVNTPLLSGAKLDVTVLAYMTGLALLTALLSGLGPAFQVASINTSDSLKESSSSAGGPRRRLRTGLIVSEIALAFVLLASVGLMIRSLWNVLHVPAGFDAENVVTMPIAFPPLQLQNRSTAALLQELTERIRNLHGVTAVALTSHLPLGLDDSRTSLRIEGREPDPTEPTRAHQRFVSPEYFETMRIRLIEGRLPTQSDLRNDFPLVVLVNRTAALKYWPGQSPVGRRILMLGTEWREVIGVVDDVKFWGLSSPVNPEVYFPILRNPTILVARTQGNTTEVIADIRDEVRQIDANLPVSSFRTMEAIIEQSDFVAPSRFYLTLLASFGLLAVSLAAAGIYGVVSYTVAQQTREIGIRMALGAQSDGILRSVLAYGLKLTSFSLALGIAASIALTQYLETLLFDVKAVDPMVYAITAFVTVAVAVAACFVPARRAAKVDPIVALRHQ